VELTEYSLSAVTEGIDALACTRVMLRPSASSASMATHSQLGDVQRTFRYCTVLYCCLYRTVPYCRPTLPPLRSARTLPSNPFPFEPHHAPATMCSSLIQYSAVQYCTL